MKRIFLLITLLSLGFTACKNDNPKPQAVAEIVVGDNETEFVLEKGNSLRKALKGGNGKFYPPTVADARVVEAKIDGNFLVLTALEYGNTVVSLRSHDKRLELKVRVEAAPLEISESDVRLFPGDVSRTVTVRGGGEDVEMVETDPEEAIEARWEGGTLEIKAKHEGEAKLVFRTKDGKPDKEMKVLVQAENAEASSRMIGFYKTTNKSLSPDFPVLLSAHRPGKMVWISSSTDMIGADKTRVRMQSLQALEQGARLEAGITFVNVNGFENGDYPLIVERVLADEGLVTLRGRGFKLVVPYDK